MMAVQKHQSISDTIVCAFSEAAFGEILVSINNLMVKFVISYRVVFKQVEVSTIFASVESTGSWLHAGTCLMFVR